MKTDEGELRGTVRRGVMWSSGSNLLLRLGGVLVGIVLARLLTPEQFGVYAVALTVQGVLMAVADFGLSADLIRARNPAPRAPTVASLGLVTGTILTLSMAFSAPAVATALGSPSAAPAISVLAITLLLAGAGVVPFAMLQRRFDQKTLFLIGIIDFVVSTTITLLLIAAGWGVMALAVGRVVAQVGSLILQFALSGERPRYGFNREEIGSILRFGVPVSAANVLSWALLGIDKVVIAILLGPVALGLYVLAFNISAWPMTAVGQVVRSVAMPMFARTRHLSRDHSLGGAVALTWALSLPIAAGLATLASPLVNVVYGERWAEAATVLAVLALFGALRATFDVFVAYLLAHGASGAIVIVQVLWIVALLPTMYFGTMWFGIVGAGAAHVVVSIFIVAPAYLFVLRRVDAHIPSIGSAIWPPILMVLPAVGGAIMVSALIAEQWIVLVAGGAFGAAAYALLSYRWIRRRLKRMRDNDTARDSHLGSEDVVTT